MRAGAPNPGVAQDSDGHSSATADERFSRLLAKASGVAAAVGIAALGLAVVATHAGIPGEGLAVGPAPTVRPPIVPASEVDKVVSPSHIADGDHVLQVKVEPPAAEHAPAPVPASDEPPPVTTEQPSAPAATYTAASGSESTAPSASDSGSKTDSSADSKKTAESAAEPAAPAPSQPSAPGSSGKDSKPDADNANHENAAPRTEEPPTRNGDRTLATDTSNTDLDSRKGGGTNGGSDSDDRHSDDRYRWWDSGDATWNWEWDGGWGGRLADISIPDFSWDLSDYGLDSYFGKHDSSTDTRSKSHTHDHRKHHKGHEHH